MGYSGPSLAARSLRSGKSDVIGVMLLDSLAYSFSDPMANKFMEGVSEVFAEHQKQMLLLSSSVASAAQIRTESLPDAFIFYGAPKGTSFQRIIQSGKPSITVDFSYQNTPSVNIDNYAEAKHIAKYALRDGAKRVAIIGMRIIKSDVVARLSDRPDCAADNAEIAGQRLHGFIDGVKESACEISEQDQFHIPVNTRQQAEIAAHQLLSEEIPPDLILCMSDVIAMAVCAVAASKGIKVPSQLKVTGFDDIPDAARHSPALTTVCQQGIEKGRLAAQMLLDNTNEQRVLPAKLIRRVSA